MSEEKENNEELVIEDVEEKDLLENQELAEQDENQPEEVAEETMKDLSDSVIDILLGEAKKKKEEEYEDEEDESEDDMEESKHDSKHDSDSEEDEDDMEESIEISDEELEEAAKKESEEGDDEEDEDEDEDMEESVKTKAGILADAFSTLVAMKKHDLVKVHESLASEGKIEEIPSDLNKANIIKGIQECMQKMEKEGLSGFYEGIVTSLETEEVELEEQSDFAEDLKILSDADANLTEDFKKKASTLFEAAVINRVNTIKEDLEKTYQESLDSEIEYVRESVIERVDNYLNYVVEEWMSENQEYVDNKLRTEISENFIKSLQNLFVENYIEVPDGKEDLVDSLSEDVEELKKELASVNETHEGTLEELNNIKKERIIKESMEDLASTDAEKLKKLVEDLDYTDLNSLEEKINIIKGSLFNEETMEESTIEEKETLNSGSEIIIEGEGEKTTSPKMKKYVSALSAFNK